jgi:hypothetical protein
VRFETGDRYRRGRKVESDQPLRAIDCQETSLAVLQDGGLFLLDPFELTLEAKVRVPPARDLARLSDRILLLTDTGELQSFALPAADPPETAAWPVPHALCLAAGPRLLAIGFDDGRIALLRHPAAGTERLEFVSALELGKAAISALCFGEGAASRFLYAGLSGSEQLIVIDLENPSGPTVCNRIDAAEPRSLSGSSLDLWLTPRDDSVAGPLVYDLLVPSLPRLDAELPWRGALAAERLGERLFVLEDEQTLATYTRVSADSFEKP